MIIFFGKVYVATTKVKNKTLQPALTPGLENPGYRFGLMLEV